MSNTEHSSNETQTQSTEPLPLWLLPFLNLCIRHPIKFVIGLLLLAGASVLVKFFSTSPNLPQIPSQYQQVVSRTDYELLKLGMTLTDAQATLGRAIEVSRNEMTVTYKWVNNDGSEITAVFKNNRLTSKQQSGLR